MSAPLDLAGHAAVVTGGSRGIGRAAALALARRGADVVVGFVSNEAAAHAVCAEVAALGRRAVARRADVRVPAEAEALVAAALEGFGRLDVLVNAAGVLREGFLMLAPDAALREVLETNVLGMMHATRAAIRPFMQRRAGGAVVNVGSVAGTRGLPGQAAYAASKGAVNAFTRQQSRELARWAVRVNAVAPGAIETDMLATVPEKARADLLAAVPLGRFGRAEEVGEAIAFLASPAASYITGQVLAIDGGIG